MTDMRVATVVVSSKHTIICTCRLSAPCTINTAVISVLNTTFPSDLGLYQTVDERNMVSTIVGFYFYMMLMLMLDIPLCVIVKEVIVS